MRSSGNSRNVIVAFGIIRVLVRRLVLVSSLEVGRLVGDVVTAFIMVVSFRSEVQIQLHRLARDQNAAGGLGLLAASGIALII